MLCCRDRSSSHVRSKRTRACTGGEARSRRMRNRIIAVLTATAVVALLIGSIQAQAPPSQPGVPPDVPPKGPVAIENQNPGDESWKSAELQAGRGTPISKADSRTRASAVWVDQAIRGYAGATSINHG